MYAIHPIVNERLVELRARELHRIAGHTRTTREIVRARPPDRRQT